MFVNLNLSKKDANIDTNNNENNKRVLFRRTSLNETGKKATNEDTKKSDNKLNLNFTAKLLTSLKRRHYKFKHGTSEVKLAENKNQMSSDEQTNKFKNRLDALNYRYREEKRLNQALHTELAHKVRCDLVKYCENGKAAEYEDFDDILQSVIKVQSWLSKYSDDICNPFMFEESKFNIKLT